MYRPALPGRCIVAPIAVDHEQSSADAPPPAKTTRSELRMYSGMQFHIPSGRIAVSAYRFSGSNDRIRHLQHPRYAAPKNTNRASAAQSCVARAICAFSALEGKVRSSTCPCRRLFVHGVVVFAYVWPFLGHTAGRPIVALAPMAGVTDASYRQLIKSSRRRSWSTPNSSAPTPFVTAHRRRWRCWRSMRRSSGRSSCRCSAPSRIIF